MPAHILIVEDEPDVARILKRVIESCGEYRVSLFAGEGGQALAERIAELKPDAIFTDLMMPGLSGLEAIRLTKAYDPELPVVVVSAYASLDNAVEAVKAGAFDFLAKPFSPESVELMLAKVERERALRIRAADAARLAAATDPQLSALLGNSPAMTRLRQWLLTVRPTRASVLIEGESGTGKELVARAIHGGAGPFVAINMAAIPETLAEAELFGYRRGAFTGAVRDSSGLMAEAHGGTLFLDEVNATPLALQAKLLRALDEKRLRPLGAAKELEADFRLVCASNVPLETRVASGDFRRDLFHRINVLSVRLPPLRARREDIPLLAEHFLHRYARAHGRNVRRFTPEALAALAAAPWPGNVRELENAIEQAVILCPPERSELPLAVLPPALGGQGWETPAVTEDKRPLTLAEAERRHVREVLRQTGGNKAEAARLLAIDYKTLLRKLAAG
jgi:DNA-binding NtrC family response regulator